MFILYAIPIGIIVGYLLGGRLEHLARLRLRWVALATIGLAIQLAVFTDPAGVWFGDVSPAVYVGSMAIVFAAVLRNVAIRGVAVIAIGAACNLAAIVANGGWMPAIRARWRPSAAFRRGHRTASWSPIPPCGR